MPNAILQAPVPGDDPCGADLRWEPEFQALTQAMDLAVNADQESVIEGAQQESRVATFDDIVTMAESLSGQTKDTRVLTIYAEAMWRGHGLAAFAEAMEDLVAVLSKWPDPDSGVHPRADPDDGDLGDRTAPIGRLMNSVPRLAATVGWGSKPMEVAERQAASAALLALFDNWRERFETSCGPNLALPQESRQALTPLIGVESQAQDPAAEQAQPGVPARPSADAWELIELSSELMIKQDHHSPAVPVLRMLMSWRSLEITEVVDQMKRSGVTMEQLLESIKRQIEGAK